MNISLAEFDWISLLFLIVAGLVGLIKSRNKPQRSSEPVFTPYTEEERGEEEEWEDGEPLAEESFAEIQPGSDLSWETADYYRERKPQEKDTDSLIKEEEEEYPNFDIRQAVISSEILNRPLY